MAETAKDKDEDYRPERIKVTFGEAIAILIPYIWRNLREQLQAVLPIVFALVLFEIAVLRKTPLDALNVGIGILFVIIGLMFYMEGLKLGLMPLGENIGNTLPKKMPLAVILAFAFVLGMGVTFAEPAIGVLKQLGSSINPTRAPLLYKLLTDWSGYLVLSVGVGVGLATTAGMLRLLYNWRLRTLIIPLTLVALALTVVAQFNAATAAMIGLAWDCGGVTTGPVTVPMVLALGLGVAAITGRADSGMAGFGIVSLASMLPVITVLGLGLAMFYTGADYQTVVSGITEAAATIQWADITISSVTGSLQAIVPLVLFLLLVLLVLLRQKIAQRDEVFLGIGLAIFGMILFNIGLQAGLTNLGNQLGQALVPQSHNLYGDVVGRIVVFLFAFVVGYGATLAEPALNAVGMTVEEVTVGAFKKFLLMHAVAFGVGLGIMTGVVKIVYGIPVVYLLVPLYALLMVLTLFSTEEFTNIGWDSGGVTTGPVTVPLVIAMGMGLAGSPQLAVLEGFGIIAMASVFPILSVVILGLIIKRKTRTIA